MRTVQNKRVARSEGEPEPIYILLFGHEHNLKCIYDHFSIFIYVNLEYFLRVYLSV